MDFEIDSRVNRKDGNYAIQLAEVVGVSSTQLGSLLRSACSNTINYALTLP
jgi:hypothetical protein